MTTGLSVGIWSRLAMSAQRDVDRTGDGAFGKLTLFADVDQHGACIHCPLQFFDSAQTVVAPGMLAVKPSTAASSAGSTSWQ